MWHEGTAAAVRVRSRGGSGRRKTLEGSVIIPGRNDRGQSWGTDEERRLQM